MEASERRKHQRDALAPVVTTAVVFVGAFLSRTVWFPAARFHPDESTVLWMALDAVRDVHIPDHGLVSSFLVFQPPGLVWATLPFVALGGGRPEPVIVAFGLANASAIALLVGTVARAWGVLYAAVLGAFLVVGPDAFFSAWIWHPSLYTASLALLMTAGIRLRHGSIWWAGVLVAVPGVYGLVHYSGLVLYAPAAVLMALSRRRWSALTLPTLCAVVLVLLAWAPFLAFEAERDWVDLSTLADATDDSSTLRSKVDDRLDAVGFALTHLGESLHGSVHLTTVIQALTVTALGAALIRRRWRDPGFAVPAATLASGLLAQLAADQGERTDALMLWHVPLYALAAWGLVQAVGLVRALVARPAVPLVAAMSAVGLIVAVGGVDLAQSVRAIPFDERLDEKWRAAESTAHVDFEEGEEPEKSPNTYYLPCDPPWGWGSEIWYLMEVLERGSGRSAAAESGAFHWRQPHRCPS
jgi:hypothetical protein